MNNSGDIEAVFVAAREGEARTVASAVREDPSLVHARGAHETTLLHVAAERDDLHLARLLLDVGAELEAEADWGHTPFEWAAVLGSAGFAGLLLEAGAKRLTLWTAAALGRMGPVVAGFEEHAPSGAEVSHAFYAACRNGHRDVAAYLLDRGADVDARGYFEAPAIHWAAVNGHREVVEWLVEQGADLTLDDPHFGSGPAAWAREGGHEELSRWLAEMGG